MSRFFALLAGLATLLSACTASPPAPPPATPSPAGSALAAPPSPAASGALAPSGSPRVAVSPGTTGTPATPASSSEARNVALLRLVIDPTNPLKLTPEEEAKVRDQMEWVLDAHTRVNYRIARAYEQTKASWPAATPRTGGWIDREAGSKRLAEAVETLRGKAGTPVGKPSDLPPGVSPPGTPPSPAPVPEPESAFETTVPEDRRLDFAAFGTVMLDVAESASAEQARKLLPELLSLQEYDKDLGIRYAALHEAAAGSDARKAQVEDSAVRLRPSDVDVASVQSAVTEWLDAPPKS